MIDKLAQFTVEIIGEGVIRDILCTIVRQMQDKTLEDSDFRIVCARLQVAREQCLDITLHLQISSKPAWDRRQRSSLKRT